MVLLFLSEEKFDEKIKVGRKKEFGAAEEFSGAVDESRGYF